MLKIISVLLVGATICLAAQSSADACWLCRRHGHYGGASASSNVSSVSSVTGVQSYQVVQTVPTFSAVASMPMVVASPMAFHGVSTAQNSNVASASVAELKSSVESMRAEIQASRSDLILTLVRELFLPIAKDAIHNRFGGPVPPPKDCGCGAKNGADSPQEGIIGEKPPGGPFPTSAAVASVPDDQMTKLIAKLDELIVELRKDRTGNEERKEPPKECKEFKECKKCEKCKAADNDKEEVPPPPEDASAGTAGRGNRLVSHRNEAGNAPTLDAKLSSIERKNRELLRRLKALQGT